MRALLFILLLALLALPGSAERRRAQQESKPAPGGGGGGYVLEHSQGNDTDNNGLGLNSSSQCLSGSFVNDSAFSLTRGRFRFRNTGGATAITITVRIFNDSSGAPGTQVGGNSTTIAASAFTGAFATYECTWGTSISLSGGNTKYHVVMVASSVGDGSSLAWAGNLAGTGDMKQSTEPPGTWNNVQSGIDAWMELYSGTP